MATDIDPHDVLLRKLRTRYLLDDDDVVAVRGVPCTLRNFLPQAYILRERQQPTKCGFLLDGFAFRQKLAVTGGRQIVSILIPGDFTDLQQLFLRQSDHNAQALTRLTLAEIPTDALRDLAFARPAIGKALWTDALIEGSITRELALNIGRRDAVSRVAHLLCEFEARLEPAGLADQGYELPMTQEQLGDATGLTSVHINRTLKQLDAEGLISRKGRFVKIEDWRGLTERADFDPLYLHLDQAI
jgi:CRP-like cAMP-binding protein